MQSIIIPNWSRKPSNGSLSSNYLKEAEESSGSSSLLYDSGVAQDQDSQDPDSRSSSPEMIPRGWLKTSGVAKAEQDSRNQGSRCSSPESVSGGDEGVRQTTEVWRQHHLMVGERTLKRRLPTRSLPSIPRRGGRGRGAVPRQLPQRPMPPKPLRRSVSLAARVSGCYLPSCTSQVTVNGVCYHS